MDKTVTPNYVLNFKLHPKRLGNIGSDEPVPLINMMAF